MIPRIVEEKLDTADEDIRSSQLRTQLCQRFPRVGLELVLMCFNCVSEILLL